ncbi:tetratricopeptide repeat-containing sulfotransferase family protein [Kangiella koreensis]|uniref:Sulfotransferase n=1 Tax=Kangiella koreensis (strain DSM 16069 / JCM 12317 / KCTC 12182 / SW-125) TaxID=523791 RepID=C7R8D0_KANKD|nr:sulfotransferase [Kangiella koreensis]ACV27695.1 sulfotransferase [Kangiella koreensis DSM 16069]
MQQYLPSANQLIQKVHFLINSNQLGEAWDLCLQLIKMFPKFADAWMTKSFIADKVGRYDEALVAINKAIRLEPGQLRFKLHKVLLLERMGELKKSLRLSVELKENNIKDKRFFMTLASFFNRHQKYKELEACYRKALELDPNNPEIMLALANAVLFIGDLDEANHLATKALRGNEFDCEVHFFRSSLKKMSQSRNNIEELKALTNKTIQDPVTKAKGFYALAKELEDCESYEESFKARERGAEIFRKSLKYDFRDDIDSLIALRETYSEEVIKALSKSQKQSNESKEAIFVVGLPRTGTTLLERIVSSHGKVSSAGELPHFIRFMSAGVEKLKLNPDFSRSEMVPESTHLDFHELGEKYLTTCRAVGHKTKCFVDKFPHNAVYAGLIHLALPQSKILILERHPLDVCYSVYKQLFTDIYQFSYDLEELAEYYYQHQLLMSHWEKVLPGVVKTVRYEDLVNNLEVTARSVIEFCGLDWEESCLDFHENKQPTATASASQVRQKVYSSSIGMWKNYRNELQPLISKLEAYGSLEGWEY